MGFTIFGLGALISSFASAKLNPHEGVEKAAAHLTNEIKARAPVDTGHLRDSYSYTVEGRGKRTVAHVGTNVEYAVHQEYGTRYQSGTPHVRPAIEANRAEIIRLMGEDAIMRFISDVSS